MLNKEQLLENQNLMEIRKKSEITADIILQKGIEVDILDFLAGVDEPVKYLGLLEQNAAVNYYMLVKNYMDKHSDVVDIVVRACNKKMPADILDKLLADNDSGFEVERAIEEYEYHEKDKNTDEAEKEDVIKNDNDSVKVKDDDEKEDKGVVNKEMEVVTAEKNAFTETVEDLMDDSIENITYSENYDENLEKVVALLTASITSDRRKTHTINNLKKIVILAEKYSKRMEADLKKKTEEEQRLNSRIYELEGERDEYKEKYYALSKKISELTNISSVVAKIED